eukprot:Skav226356  [mRNA]  locus=scaffold2980:360023:361087:- [translate_table: standard]
MQAAWEDHPPNRGWKCGPCKRMNKKVAEYCQLCYRHWSQVQELTRDQMWTQPDWGGAPPAASSNAQERQRSTSRRARQRNSQGWNAWHQWSDWEQQQPKPKDKATPKSEPAPPTPFSPYVPSSADPPWSQTATPFQGLVNPQGSSGSSTSNPNASSLVNQELVKALREAYSEAEKVPDAVQALLSKVEEDDSKQVIKVLHQTTNALGRAKKQQQDLLEQRRRHRLNWLQHLEESSKMWQQQLEQYRVRQAEYQASLAKAAADISAARNKILALNLKELPQSLQGLSELEPETPALEETTQDNDEEKLRTSLQATLTACAASVGPINIEAARLSDISDVQERERKRPAPAVESGS